MPIARWWWLAVLASHACTASTARGPTAPHAPTVEDLVRVRCDRDGRDVVLAWTGSIHAFPAGEPPRRLFGVVGMNIARCIHHRDGWWLTSRELMLYLDPRTGQVLERWTNPWTGAATPVMHVANRLVQFPLSSPALSITGDIATVSIEAPLSYPNPLAADPVLRAYDPAPTYRAIELFALSAPAAATIDPNRASVPTLVLAWTRVGPWLPWMRMAGREGYLVYSTHGRKLAGLDDLPAALRRELDERVPLYRRAPTCIVAGRNETSWTYFASHVAAFEAGARFPLPAPASPDTCADAAPTP